MANSQPNWTISSRRGLVAGLVAFIVVLLVLAFVDSMGRTTAHYDPGRACLAARRSFFGAIEMYSMDRPAMISEVTSANGETVIEVLHAGNYLRGTIEEARGMGRCPETGTPYLYLGILEASSFPSATNTPLCETHGAIEFW